LLHGFSLFGTVNYSRLVGDFKRSPIVSQRGSPNQWLLAGGLAYTW
jgi:outer membrane scaffolding protein for murein synthesis (MipA/OmpV family)